VADNYKIMKKIYYHLLVIFLGLCISSCAKYDNSTTITTTIQPFKLIIQEITGPEYTIHNLMPASASPHTFRLRPSDLRNMENTQILFSGGKNLDNWAADLQVKNKIELNQIIPDGYLQRFADDHSLDPHFWTDPLAVRAMLPKLGELLIKHSSIDSNRIRANISSFSHDLAELNNEIAVLTGPHKQTPVVLSHPFFRYYLLRYGFKIAGIIEHHPGHQPTAKSVEEMIRNLLSKNVKLILTHPAHADDIADLLSEAANIPVCQLDPVGKNPQIDSYHELILFNTKLIVENLN
jgi:zinc transport system substrate-binding protein